MFVVSLTSSYFGRTAADICVASFVFVIIHISSMFTLVFLPLKGSVLVFVLVTVVACFSREFFFSESCLWRTA